MNSADLTQRIHFFLRLHFRPGEANPPNWQMDPYCDDLFRIYRDAIESGENVEELIACFRDVYDDICGSSRVSTIRPSISDLYATLQAWALYERCRGSMR